MIDGPARDELQLPGRWFARVGGGAGGMTDDGERIDREEGAGADGEESKEDDVQRNRV